MREILIVVGSNEGKNSNSYHIEKYIENILKYEANFTEILLSEVEESSSEKIIRNLERYDNLVFISNLRKDVLNNISDKFLMKLNEYFKKFKGDKSLYVSFILNGDIDTLKSAEEINFMLEKCNKLCEGENIIWQKGIGSISDLELWKRGLNSDESENEQLILELEMFCQDVKNNKTYHHNSFATPVRGKGILGFLNKKLQQFN
ncbi:hypothetical protein [Clostridium sp. B9]|uniref:hypothetical protein n=1 Tax=Clostridium sp. B9 TaxID=3423224 RepID=UPI003D2F412E